MRFCLRICLMASAALAPVPTLAQQVADPCETTICAGDGLILPARRILPEEITVLANGQRLLVEDSGQAISVVGEDEIDSIQGPDLTRVLERLPGVTLARNGGLGTTTGLFVRGANSQQVLVLVDGVRVADTAAPSGGYDFGNLATGAIGKVELLRGSNSVVWGSEAVGGVIALTTREVRGIEASAEYGANDTVNADVTGGLRGVTLSAGYTDTDGFSQAASGTEADGFRQYRASARADVRLTDRLSLIGSARFADSRLEFDGFSFSPPFGLIDTDEFSETEEISGRAGLKYAGDGLALTADYSRYEIDRDNFNPAFGSAPSFASEGRQERIEARASIDLPASFTLDTGASHEWSRFDTNFDEPGSADITGAYGLLGWRDNRLSLAAGARIDDHSDFGSEVTLGANGSLDIGQDWRVRASYGEGFKAPTLYQLLSDFGNEALVPERSRSYDVGIEHGSRRESFHFAATLFRRDTRDLIDFVSCFSVADPLCDDGRFGFYENTGRARAEGFELELGASPSDNLRAQAVYTYVKATDRESGNDLARRPRHAVLASLDWSTPLAGLNLGADVRMVSGSFDDAGNFTRLDGYAVGTLRASLPVTDQVELFGRIENVTDETYQTAAGYNTQGRAGFVGARARF